MSDFSLAGSGSPLISCWDTVRLRPSLILTHHSFIISLTTRLQVFATPLQVRHAPQFTAAPVGCELRFFRPVTPTKVIKLAQALPDKQCSSDPLPTWLLKANVSVLAPFLCRLFCWSLQHGVVPSRMKSAYVTPILKKAGMDSADSTSYRPITLSPHFIGIM